MKEKNEKIIKVIRDFDKDSQVRIDGSILYLQEVKP
ncbi:hypothetical protein IWQ47_005084 [Aquimarina sp. EL_43]|nr:hypothetical protein [Aquimarina sp. EL_35]MBG6153781.1 hypothetical protein [Aquimarina sp. EL_32]MBG6171985.1 hypothetical protein [Aquimarina sp. EL_43]